MASIAQMIGEAITDDVEAWQPMDPKGLEHVADGSPIDSLLMIRIGGKEYAVLVIEQGESD